VLSSTITALEQQDMFKLSLTAQQRINVDLQNASLPDALQTLERTAGIEIRIADDVRETLPMTVHFTDTRFGDVLMFVLTNAHLYYHFEGTTVVVTSKRPMWKR
jgi:hypothetical protein